MRPYSGNRPSARTGRATSGSDRGRFRLRVNDRSVERHRVVPGEARRAVALARIVVVAHRLEHPAFTEIAERVGFDEGADLLEALRGADELRAFRRVDAVIAGP